MPVNVALLRAFNLIEDHEKKLLEPLMEFLRGKWDKGVRIVGLATSEVHVRAPTVSFIVVGEDGRTKRLLSKDIVSKIDQSKKVSIIDFFHPTWYTRDAGVSLSLFKLLLGRLEFVTDTFTLIDYSRISVSIQTTASYGFPSFIIIPFKMLRQLPRRSSPSSHRDHDVTEFERPTLLSLYSPICRLFNTRLASGGNFLLMSEKHSIEAVFEYTPSLYMAHDQSVSTYLGPHIYDHCQDTVVLSQR